MLKKIIAVVALIASPSAFGAFTTDQVVQATKIAVDEFKTTAHAEHFVGFKSWKSGEEAKVKIYVNHGGTAMEVNYTCHQHDNEIECHAQ